MRRFWVWLLFVAFFDTTTWVALRAVVQPAPVQANLTREPVRSCGTAEQLDSIHEGRQHELGTLCPVVSETYARPTLTLEACRQAVQDGTAAGYPNMRQLLQKLGCLPAPAPRPTLTRQEACQQALITQGASTTTIDQLNDLLQQLGCDHLANTEFALTPIPAVLSDPQMDGN
jgi:hypothetical protein